MDTGKHPDRCREIFALLSEYLDSELPAGDCAELERHLADCPPCIEFLNSLKETVRLCHDCGPAEAPPPLTGAQRKQLLAAYQKAIGRKS